MFRRTFKVIFRPMKNSFVLLPENYYNLVSSYENGCLNLTFGSGNHSHCSTWVPYAGTNIKDTEIGINARVAKELGLKENDLVKCSLIADVMALKNVYVTPVSAKDWELIELSNEKISGSMLDQIRVINSCQILTIWLNKSMQVNLTVDRLKPNINYGRIDHTTEVIVSPNHLVSPSASNETNGTSLAKSQTSAALSSTMNGLTRSMTTKSIKSFLPPTSEELKAKRIQEYEQLIKELKKESTRTFQFRVISGKWEGGQFSDVFVTKHNLPAFMDIGQIFCLKTAAEKEYYVSVKVISDCETFPKNIHPTIEMNENLMKLLSLDELQKVTLTAKNIIRNFVEKIELFANKKTHYKTTEAAFKKYVLDNSKMSPILLNQDQVVRLENDLIVSVKITPDHLKYCLIDEKILKECKIYAADEVKSVDEIFDIEPSEDSPLSVKHFIKLKKIDDIVDRLVAQTKIDLCLDQRNSILGQANILIEGPPNCGKSVLVERVIDRLAEKPFYCSYSIFYCTRNKGRKPESIQKDLRQIFTTSLMQSPSIVVLENLDVLAHSTGEQQTQDSEYFNRVADTIHNLINEYTGSNAIAVIATVSSVKALNCRLYPSRGRHLFQTTIRMPEIDRDDRETIIRNLCNDVECSKIDFKKYAKLTEGYSMGDLVQFVERAIFYAYRLSKDRPVLSNEFLRNSLESTNAYCLQGVQNFTNCKEDDDEEKGDLVAAACIPGLESVVTVLEEVILWPAKYPGIFKDSPLRNQAGVLLYGPPGTGKTMLVAKIAKVWSLRMISVKGPELLAKYIGQSEENVRALFQRARSAKPCVLFFDEFDSLAPKRGHDSTGVTDRVVNQLLTEMDGVEGLEGVTVVAATSRPELIDPALLRSGRIDRKVECPLPDKCARLKIFKYLSESLHLDKSVEFEYFAERTESYTGADIQSILTSANLMAVKESLDKYGPEHLPDIIYITQKHLMTVFADTKPSLSAKDIARYKHTYAQFTNAKLKVPRDMVSKRTTLA